jgi:hypothetical protein
VGLRIAQWHRSSEPPLPSSPLPWPLPMGAITTLCIVNLERAVAFPTSHLRRDSTDMHYAPSACTFNACSHHPPTLPAGQAHGYTVDAQHHPYLSCGHSPTHTHAYIVPVASSSRITLNGTHSPRHADPNAERTRPHSHRTKHTDPTTLTPSIAEDHRPLRVDSMLTALLAWARAHV